MIRRFPGKIAVDESSACNFTDMTMAKKSKYIFVKCITGKMR